MTQLLTENYALLYDEILKNLNADVISYGVSDNYIPNWTEKEALTEYIANFYDENKTDFTIETIGDSAVLISDKSQRGIKLEDLAFGNSNSREYTYKIGTHGEGFKLGALVLVRLGKRVLIETIGHTIAFFLDYEENLGSNVLKTKVVPNNRTEGSSIYLETNLVDDVKNRFLFLNDKLHSLNDFLFTQDDYRQNHIFVNTLGSQQITSAFSYSIHKKQKVNRDRNMIEFPQQDIAIQLFTSNNLELLTEWFNGLPTNLNDYFEEDIIQFFMENRKKAMFKTTDMSIVMEAAKSVPIHFYYGESSVMAHYQYANPSIHFLSSHNPFVNSFFELTDSKFQQSSQYIDLNASLKNGDTYSYLVSDTRRRHSYDQLFDQLFYLLRMKKVAKSHLFIDGKVQVVLSKNIALDLEKGTVRIGNQKSTKPIVSIVEALALLLKAKVISIKDWDYTLSQLNGYTVFSIKTIPSYFEVELHHENLEHLAMTNVHFIKHNVVLKDLALELNGQQWSFDTDGNLVEPLNSLYSYSSYTIQYPTSVFELVKSPKYMAKIFAHLNNLEKIEYELHLFERFLTQTGSRHIIYENDVRTCLSSLFVKNFGLNSCVSVDEASDKGATYNGYRVIELPKELKNLYIRLSTNLSSQVKGIASTKYNVISHPNGEVSDYQNSPYIKLVKSCIILQGILEQLYSDMRHSDKYWDGFSSKYNDLLPNKKVLNTTEMSIVNERNATASNFKKMIERYVFVLFGKTHIVNTFDDTSVRGLCDGQSIFVKDMSKGFLGTFLHEYVHLSTGLADINVDFEKMLAFIGVMGYQQQHLLTDDNIEAFIKDYEKFIRG